MELFETATYSPQQHAFFPHSSHPLLSLHASSRYFSFQTRTHELILADTSTGRMIVLYKAQHAFECSVFTHDYLLAAHQTCHQVLVFSLKAGKLKSRLTGHLADLHTLAYCRQTDQIASLSSQFCFIHAQKTLVHVKTIKCSTSSFVDCQFALTGSLFATSFKDGSVLLWDPVSWNHRSSAVIERSPRVALGDGNILAVYSPKKLWLSDTTQQITTHEQAQSFWEGEIKQIVFIDNMLVLSGTDCTYVAQVNQTHNLRVQKLRKLELVSACVAHTQYQSTLVSLSTDLRKISVFSLLSTNANITKRTNNPLTNEGLVCAGGYDKSQGCHVANQIVTNNNYSPVQMAIEPLTQACYAQIPNSMNLQQLKRFLLKNHTLPDKYRPIAYRHALKLPISPQQFRQLQRKGLHPSTQLLGNKYPLPNKELCQSMRQVMSLLAHWQGVIGESELVPPIVFGFVCLFGKDIFFCFQVLVRLFVGPLSFLFTQFPLANSQLLQNLWQILKGEDEELCRHFQKNSIRFTRLAWGLLGSFFTSVMSRQNFLAIADLVLVRADEPELVLFVCLSYLIFNRKRLLSANDEDSAGSLCQQEQTLHIGKFLTLVGKLHSKWHKKVRYGLKVWLQRGHYQNISVPKEAVLMHEQRRNVLVEQLQKQKENEAQREKMLKQMQKMVVNARRQAERQLLESQAYQLHSQQQNNPIQLQPIDRSSRIQKLQSLINQLTVALERQQLSRDQVRQYVPALQLVKVASDSTLDQLELKLLQVLGEVRPSNSLRPFLSQPANLVKLPADKTGLQGAVGARLAGNLWEMDQLYNKGHASKWKNCMLAATQK